MTETYSNDTLRFLFVCDDMEMRLGQTLKLAQECKLKQELKQELKLVQLLKLQIKQTIDLALKQFLKTILAQYQGAILTQRLKNQILKQTWAVIEHSDEYKSQSDAGIRLHGEIYFLKKMDKWWKSNAGSRILETGGVSREPFSSKFSLQLRPTQNLALTQKLALVMRNWSFVNAYEQDNIPNRPKAPLELKHKDILGFDKLSHDNRMVEVDNANKIFRFEYGFYNEGGRKKYYKIPILRDLTIPKMEISVPISKNEFNFAIMVLESAGAMEKIARAIPFGALNSGVKDHLEQRWGVSIYETVIIGVDRGGRLPAKILGRALNSDNLAFLKVDQGQGKLDNDRLNEFAEAGTLRGKHALFVDSTVDSGRQITALKKHLNRDSMSENLGFKSWNIVGSNDRGSSLTDEHFDIDWGIDPDVTFEDDPVMMGVDYAPGRTDKIIEVASVVSKKVLELINKVPDGDIIDLEDARRQFDKILGQRKLKK